MNHPLDCTRSPLLLCSTEVKKFQGTGSRLFFLGRCLAESLNSGRAIILTNELESTIDMLKPFEDWGNCSLRDATKNLVRGRVKRYYPMDSKDLAKSTEMPATGALYPGIFKNYGYWWWKAQEISYALRPTLSTLEAFEELQGRQNWSPGNVTVFQIRRTDKTEGCSKFYGKNTVSCKAEASAPSIFDFLREGQYFSTRRNKNHKILIVTDDHNIHSELEAVQHFDFVWPEPAPQRVVDKVKIILFCTLKLIPMFIYLIQPRRRKVEFLRLEH